MPYPPFVSLPALALAYLALRGRSSGYGGDASMPEAGPDPVEGPPVNLSQIPAGELDGWTFPIPAWGEYHASRSQEFKPVTHLGCDIMYPRATHGTAQDRVFKPGTPNGSKNWFMPDGVPVLCPRAGKVWSTGVGEHGPYCVIDCGKPFAIYMVHFDQLMLPTGIAAGAGGYRVSTGQMIGTVGFSPADGERLKHLHIEVWYNGPRSAARDPWPYLANAKR